MKRVDNRALKFVNRRTGEIWICESYQNRRSVDGVEFIEVHRPDSQRTVWMNLETLERVRTEKSLDK